MNTIDKISLKMARIKAGFKQQDVAKELQISRGFLNKIEAGKAFPKVDLALALAKLYGLSLNEIDFLCH